MHWVYTSVFKKWPPSITGYTGVPIQEIGSYNGTTIVYNYMFLIFISFLQYVSTLSETRDVDTVSCNKTSKLISMQCVQVEGT